MTMGEEMLRLGGVAVIAVSIALVLKNQRPELALQVSIVTGIVLLAAAIAIAGEVKRQAEEFMQNYSVDGNGIAAVVKITGIAYTAQFSADICRDAGESAVASRIELAGRLMMLLAALPMVFSAVEAICGLLGALLLSPGMARAEEISIPAVEYDISGWEDIWREMQVETGGAAGGASVSDAIARIKEGNLDGLLDLGRIVGLFKEKLTEGVKGMLGIIAAAFFSAAAGAAVGTQKGVGEMLSFCLTGLCISVAAACVCAQMKEAQRVIDGVAQLGELVSPALMVMIAAAGGSAVSAVQPTSVLLCSGMTEAFRNTFMPFILMMCALSTAGTVSENKQLKAMAGLIKSLLKWGMGLTFTFFLGSVSIKSLNAAGLDSAGVKALKYAFDKSVPVVGGVISGTYEGLRAGAIVLKNAAGTVALLLLLLYFTAPGIRMLCSVISMRITAAICAVADDGRISAMLTAAADSCTYMFAVSAIAVLMNMLAVAAALLASGVG